MNMRRRFVSGGTADSLKSGETLSQAGMPAHEKLALNALAGASAATNMSAATAPIAGLSIVPSLVATSWSRLADALTIEQTDHLVNVWPIRLPLWDSHPSG